MYEKKTSRARMDIQLRCITAALDIQKNYRLILKKCMKA